MMALATQSGTGQIQLVGHAEIDRPLVGLPSCGAEVSSSISQDAAGALALALPVGP